MGNMKTVQEIANEASRWFITTKRDSGEEFTKTKDGRPQWLTDLIFTAHGDMGPDDWKYDFISKSLDVIANSSDDDLECPTIEADVYTSDLTRWLHSRADRVYYLTEALEEYGMKDGFEALQMAELKEIEEVYYSVLASLQKLVEDQDQEEDDTEE